MSRLTASRAAFDLIASFEGFRTRAVLAPDGQWTLGFGHTATAREGLTVTRAEAEDLLRWDLLPIEDALRQIALTPLSQSQFDALVSFAFNVGLENFRTSDVLKFLNQGQPVAAALSMHAWRRASVNGRVLTIDALVRRRAAESALFLETTGARPAAPTSIIRPQIDYSAALLSHTADTTKVETDREDVEIANDVESNAVKPEVEAELAPADEANETQRAADHAPTIVLAETIAQEVLTQEPIVRPSMTIPPMPMLPESTTAQSVVPRLEVGTAPMVPEGLSPFPGSPVYAPANGTNDTAIPPANDGLKTRLHNTPEQVSIPTDPIFEKAKGVKEVADGPSLLIYGLMTLGALLLAGGLFYSWKVGILTVTTPRTDPTSSELSALLAAATGFIILVTSAVAAFTGRSDDA
jgi:lysozyme